MKLRANNKSAFTLVEIMIVVAIIGLLAAIAVPHFIRSRIASRRNVCISNLKQMQGAKVQWALEKSKVATDTPAEADLIGPDNYLREKPVCPSGGDDYLTTIGTVQDLATCTFGPIEGHSL